jgi:ectoine hydroxylase
MKLTAQQVAQFDRDGYLFFPSLFTPAEIGVLTEEVPRLYAMPPPRERSREGQRCGAHEFRRPHVLEAFREDSRAIRAWSIPVVQIFGEKVYMHQFKINGKAAFDGDVWQWHQDYGTWKNDDLMPEARAMNVAIFLDEVNEFNGPLMFIPGSHKQGALPAGHDTSTTSYPAVDHRPRHDLEARGAGRHRGAQGRAGIDDPFPRLPGSRVHVEPVAMEPGERVSQPLRGVEPHPPLQAPGVHRASRLHADRHASDDCLLKDYDVQLPWKDGTPKTAFETERAA